MLLPLLILANKELPFLDMADRSSIAVQVEDELMVFKEDYSLEEKVSLEEPPTKKIKKGPIVTELFSDVFEQKKNPAVQSDEARREVRLYKSEKPAELDSNPLLWWLARKEVYPLMSRLAQKYFSINASSVPSERLFSSYNVYTYNYIHSFH